MRGEAAVPRVAGELRAVAEVFHALLAETADAASVSKPGDSDPVTDPMCGDVAADEIDAADDFVAGNNRTFDAGKLRVDDVKVGPANPARAYLDANFSVAGVRVCPLLHLERRPRGRQHHRTHLFLRHKPLWSPG